jgi:hypothetical protein
MDYKFPVWPAVEGCNLEFFNNDTTKMLGSAIKTNRIVSVFKGVQKIAKTAY